VLLVPTPLPRVNPPMLTLALLVVGANGELPQPETPLVSHPTRTSAAAGVDSTAANVATRQDKMFDWNENN
jgi:hypothetical protein